MKVLTLDAVTRQADAMGVEIFEVGLYKPVLESGSKEPEMLPRTWDKGTLLRSTGWLKFQNSQGRNIYIRPKGEHALSLVDDLTAESVQRMKAEGFQPAVVIETSPGNFQAWLNHGRVLSKAESTAAARALAEKFGGDKGAADWRHFGRLAGLTNRKQKHQASNGQYPFVRLIETSGQHYDQANRFVSQVAAELATAQLHQRMPQHISAARARESCLKSIDSFRANPVYAGDNTRIDLAYAVYALAHGAPLSAVEEVLRNRDLSHKGNDKRQAEYIERTLQKAQDAVTSRVVVRGTPSRSR
jgi:hypothetical protein